MKLKKTLFVYTQLAPNDPKLNLGRFLATFHKIYNARFAKVHQFLKNGQNYYLGEVGKALFQMDFKLFLINFKTFGCQSNNIASISIVFC